MRIAIISCGRSDYSIYFPLMRAINENKDFELNIIAFGTHVSTFHGSTIEEFYRDGFDVDYKIESLVLGDSPEAISTAIGLTAIKFAAIWAKENYDLVFVLGDRYEMFAAVASAVPFNIPIAHLHGGETTLGAIDDKFRHSITAMSTYHFTSTKNHSKRVVDIIGNSENVFNVGALAIDSINSTNLLDKEQFYSKYGINLNQPTILSTYHPETVSLENNLKNVDTLFSAFKNLTPKQIIITMPNADTMGNRIRQRILELAKDEENIIPVENFGLLGYYSCIKHSEFLIGNTSSGIIEAASFGKYVINLGDRQKGRESGSNVIHCEIEKDKIIDSVKKISHLPLLNNFNIYGDGTSASKIIDILKKLNL